LSNPVYTYFNNLSSTQVQQLEGLMALYMEWNAKINVISRKDIDLLYERHVLHSLGIAKVMGFAAGSSVLDVGTGGGFPGIPLAILFPETQFVLCDSIQKKIKVVEAVSNGIGLKNVTAVHARVEDIKQQFDFIVSRAVTEFPVFYNWVRGKVHHDQKNTFRNGILYLKGGDLMEEFGRYYDKAQFFQLSDFFEEEFFATKKVVYYPLS